MYYTVQQTAENLEIDLGYLMHLIQTKQVKTVEVDGELLLNSAQFDFFLKQRERLIAAQQKKLIKMEAAVEKEFATQKEQAQRELSVEQTAQSSTSNSNPTV